MLSEGRRRKDRGTDVVVGFVETHGRQRTAEQIGDLEVVPRRAIEYKGATFEEMDVDAMLARRPQVALVDELAHTNVPGSRNEKRWQDVEELLGGRHHRRLDAQHPAPRIGQRRRRADHRHPAARDDPGRGRAPCRPGRARGHDAGSDPAPDGARQHLPAERIDAALGNYFREGNLAALRELALMWVADRVDEGLAIYRERDGIERPWETRERVLVGLVGVESDDHSYGAPPAWPAA